MQPTQPKISQKLLIRSAIGLFALAGLFFAYRYYKSIESDPFGGVTVETPGMVAAIETVGEGKHVVVIKDDGTVLRQENVSPASEDRDVVWRPDGNALFFSSNRLGDKFTMFRWAPTAGRVAEQRSVGGRAQGSPSFLASDADLHQDAKALITAGGAVMEYDPKRPAMHQVLPPVDPSRRVEVTDEGSGDGPASAFEAQYARLGTSFRKAKWTPDKSGVIAVMKRENGEILMFQKLNPADQQDALPRPIMAGDHVDFDIDPVSGIAYFTVQNFQWWDPEAAPAEYKKGNRVTVPFRHCIGIFDPAGKKNGVITITKADNLCFGQIAVKPDGTQLAVVYGKYEGDGNMTPLGLTLLAPEPLKTQPPAIVSGEVYEPTWSPTGDAIAYALRESGKSRPIFIVQPGVAPRRLTPGEGVFSNPVFSPQAPKAGS